jgi:hypothetical protein
MAPTCLRGLSDPYGSWKTIWTWQRSALSASRLAPTTRVPAISSSPLVGSSIIVTSRARVDLPQPDSPTTARVLPGVSLKETPATARSEAGSFRKPRLT